MGRKMEIRRKFRESPHDSQARIIFLPDVSLGSIIFHPAEINLRGLFSSLFARGRRGDDTEPTNDGVRTFVCH